jgi:hypothetical protein
MDSPRQRTSLQIFRQFFTCDTVTHEKVSLLLSEDCYIQWLAMHKGKSKTFKQDQMAKIYQRTISSHLTGADGRATFTPEEETAVLFEVRQKRVWPCFASLPKAQQHGRIGFRAMSFHERRRAVPSEAVKEDDEEATDDGASPELPVRPLPMHAEARAALDMSLTCLERCGDDYAGSLWALQRSILLSKTPAAMYSGGRSPTQAQELIAHAECFLNKPHAMVHVIDPMAGDPTKRVLAQNAKSRGFMGELTTGHGVKLVPAEGEMRTVLRLVFESMFSPGQGFSDKIRYVLDNGKALAMRVTYYHEPGSYLRLVCSEVDGPMYFQ